MFNIADYFKKFAKIEGDSVFESDAIKSAIYDACGIDKIFFDVKKGIIYIKGSPIMKSLIYTKKSIILASIKEKLPQTRITDIK